MTFPGPEAFSIVTSSPVKIREYQRIAGHLLKVNPGEDLREVDGTADQVILYKALAGGEGRIVEDTILIVDGVPWIDIKWRIAGLLRGDVAEGTPLTWQVRLGVQWEGSIYSFLGEIHGVVCPFSVEGAGMDPIFYLKDQGKTLAELDLMGEKDGFSARSIALKNLLEKKFHTIVDVSMIPAWAGKYQNED